MTHYAPLVAALVSMLLSIILLLSKTGKLSDGTSREESSESDVPRIGGIALVAGIFSGWALVFKSLAWWIVLPSLLLFAISLIDDMQGLSVRKRLMAHAAFAFLLILGSGVLVSNPLLAALIMLAVIWMTNLFDFMDGSDGLAGGMAFIGFSVYGIASLIHGEETQAMLNFSIGAAALGFLYNNVYPAKILMGEAGAITLGFLAAAMGLWGWQQGSWSGWFPLLVFLPFVADTTVTLFKRILGGKGVVQKHSDHYYQRLLQLGWHPRKLASISYILMILAGVSAVWAQSVSKTPPWGVLLVWAGLYALMMLALEMKWRSNCG